MRKISLTLSLLLFAFYVSAAPANVSGRVTCEGAAVSGVLVSDGEKFVRTDAKGQYKMQSNKAQKTIFIVTPSGYVAESKDGLQPGFWAPLSDTKKEVHDFTLKKEDQTVYSTAFIADLHLCSVDKRGDLEAFHEDIKPLFKGVKERYSEIGPVYTINLGDLSFEKFWYDTKQRKAGGYFRINEVYDTLKKTEMPGLMYSVLGNHDHDGALRADKAEETEFLCAHSYREIFGPSWYSVNIGGDHWIFINSVQYLNTPTDNPVPGLIGRRNYREDFRPESLEWLKEDLKFVPKDTKVYFCTHCSLLFHEYRKRKNEIPESTKKAINDIFAAWGGDVQVFSGHRHQMDWCESEQYPKIKVRSISATSGDCWQTKRKSGENFSFDGTPQGVAVGVFKDKGYELNFITVGYGEKYMKAYDEGSSVLVNYWLWKKGDVVEVFENGEKRQVTQTSESDPMVRNDAFFTKAKTPKKAPLTFHMFRSALESPTSLVEIVVRDAEGKEIARDILRASGRIASQAHPRLFIHADEFEAMKKVANGPDDGSIFYYYNKCLIEDIRKNPGETLEFKKDASGRRILQISRAAEKELTRCAWAYRMTGEKEFLDRAEKTLREVCSFPEWNPSHYLDVAEMSVAVATAYDWLYNDLSPEIRGMAEKALGEFGLKTAVKKIDGGKFTFKNNWGQVCYGGLTCAAIATADIYPEMAQKVISKAFQHSRYLTEKFYNPNGFYPEGPGYWSFGTSYQIMLMMALDASLGTDAGLSEVAGFKTTALATMSLYGPCGSFSYSDGHKRGRLAITHIPELWYFARKYSDPSQAYLDYRLISKARKAGKPVDVKGRLEVISLINSFYFPKGNISKPKMLVGASFGEVPLIVARTGWTSGDSYLGFKGGKANDNHAHMDGGSFIFDAEGIRWSADIGAEIYSKVEKALKDAAKTYNGPIELSLWSRTQDSPRFQVFSYNNRQHSTITVNDKDFLVDARVTILDVINEPDRLGGTMDMTRLYGGDLESARRTAVLKGKDLEITDVLKAPAGKTADIRWTLVSEAKAEAGEFGIRLKSGKKTALLSTSGAKVNYQTWSNDPRSRKTFTSVAERDCSRYSVSGFTLTIPKGAEVTLVTTISLELP